MRCEIPVRSSTRASRTVSPSSPAAAGLKTALTGYGQSSAVRIGLAGWRVKSSRESRHAAATPAARTDARHARRVEDELRRGGTRASTRHLRWRSGPRCRARRCNRRSRSRRAAAEVVAPEEPLEGAVRADAVLGVAGDDERRELRLDDRGRVERLLVAGARCGSSRCRPRWPVSRSTSSVEPALVAEPARATRARRRRGPRVRARCRRR